MEKLANFSADKVFKATLKMNNGLTIPQIGLGTYGIKTPEPYHWALKYGYRHFDSGAFYGNEAAIGQQIKKGYTDFGLKREDVFIASKISPHQQGYEKATRVIEKSLQNFDLGYIDLMLVPHPATKGLEPQDQKNTENRHGTWKALEEFVEKGLIKSIGVGNFRPNHMQMLLDVAKIKPVINQIEIHPMYMEYDTIEFCKKNDILLEAYSPFALQNTNLIHNQVISKIALNHGIDVSRVILTYLISKGFIVIPKSANEERLANNIQLNGIQLSEEDISLIDDLGKKHSIKVRWDFKDVV